MAIEQVKLDYDIARQLLDCIDKNITEPVKALTQQFLDSHSKLKIEGVFSDMILQSYLPALCTSINANVTGLRSLANTAFEASTQLKNVEESVAEEVKTTADKMAEEVEKILAMNLDTTEEDVSLY